MKMNYLWRERKRNALGLPWSFTVYTLTEDVLYIEKGFLSKKLEEVYLYRIVDTTLVRKLNQRFFNLGTIHFYTNDKTTSEFDLVNIKNPMEVKALIAKATEECRMKKGVTIRELMGDVSEEL